MENQPMHIRCPACRRTTLVLEEQIEHLTRCDRCGMMLHVRVSRADGADIRLVARPIPRPVAVRPAGRALGIFATPTLLPEPTLHAPPRIPDHEAIPLDATLAALAAARARARRPSDPLRARRQQRLLRWGYTSASATALVMILVLGVLVAGKLHGVFQPASLAAAEPPKSAAQNPDRSANAPARALPPAAKPLAPTSAQPGSGELFPDIKGQ